jgi:hypothetical protein
MFGSPILDVAIGLVFLYLLLSLIASAVNELIEGLLKNRAKDLEKGMRELLQDPNGSGLVKRFYEHPLINGLFAGPYVAGKTKNLPSYIPARTFAMVLLDLVPAGGPAVPPAAGGAAPAPVPAAGGAAAAPAPLPAGGAAAAPLPIPEGITRAVEMFRRDAATARENAESWFNNSMERVGGWYKRRAQLIIFCIGLGAALAMNADSIVVAKGLISDGTLRQSAVAAATAYFGANTSGAAAGGAAAGGAAPGGATAGGTAPGGATTTGTPTTTPPASNTPTASPDERLKAYLTTLTGLGLPIGWNQQAIEAVPGRIPDDFPGWLLKLAGCLLTACAVSLGAPFWFDMLNKIITARSTIKPQEKRAAAA